MASVPTRMMVDVSGPAEAEAAVAAGADIVVAPGGLAAEALRAIVAAAGGRSRSAARAHTADDVAAAWACGVEMVLYDGTAPPPGQGVLLAVRYADGGEAQADPVALGQGGYAGVLLDISPGASGRLLRHADLTALLDFARACRRLGLQVGFAGGLELPDVPRLMLLHPDMLGVRGRPARLRQFRALITAATPDGRDTDGGDTDRIFVRDLVLPVRIGAYAHERDAPQTMRFSVEAWITRPVQPVHDMRDIVSYDIISDNIRLLASSEHVDLVEVLAERIAAAVLTHPRVVKVRVTLEKLETGSGSVGVMIERRRHK